MAIFYSYVSLPEGIPSMRIPHFNSGFTVKIIELLGHFPTPCLITRGGNDGERIRGIIPRPHRFRYFQVCFRYHPKKIRKVSQKDGSSMKFKTRLYSQRWQWWVGASIMMKKNAIHVTFHSWHCTNWKLGIALIQITLANWEQLIKHRFGGARYRQLRVEDDFENGRFVVCNRFTDRMGAFPKKKHGVANSLPRNNYFVFTHERVSSNKHPPRKNWFRTGFRLGVVVSWVSCEVRVCSCKLVYKPN